MKIILKINQENEPTEGIFFYYKKSLSIEYDTKKFNNNEHLFLLIYDTLTICFNLKSEFVSLDAYAPIESWTTIDSFELPNANKGTLEIEVLDKDDNRCSFDFIPIYQKSDNGYLKILFSEREQGSWFQIANNCFFRIFENEVNTIIFSKLNFRDE